MDPKTGKIYEGIVEQTRQALENVKTILDTAGTSMENVIKTTVFITDISEFNQMNNVYSTFFKGNYPARSTIEVSKLALPDLKVEIEAIAYVKR